LRWGWLSRECVRLYPYDPYLYLLGHESEIDIANCYWNAEQTCLPCANEEAMLAEPAILKLCESDSRLVRYSGKRKFPGRGEIKTPIYYTPTAEIRFSRRESRDARLRDEKIHAEQDKGVAVIKDCEKAIWALIEELRNGHRECHRDELFSQPERPFNVGANSELMYRYMGYLYAVLDDRDLVDPAPA
jgi:hypothetical protein